MKTLRELLVEHNIKEGYDLSIRSLRESLDECFKTVWQGDSDEHRWYVAETRVVEIPDGQTLRYFSYQVCTYSGENSAKDAGFQQESIDSIVEVFPKEVTTTIWVTKDKL